jgi:hypothetical protein
MGNMWRLKDDFVPHSMGGIKVCQRLTSHLGEHDSERKAKPRRHVFNGLACFYVCVCVCLLCLVDAKKEQSPLHRNVLMVNGPPPQ